jgi:energy-coupling factor transporter ATP-binding protein EcfA2
MKLKKVHVTEFQSVLDSEEFEVGDITCLVGKNEAGKTAVLQALYRLNPLIEGHAKYSVTDDYPRWDVEDYRLAVEAKEREPATVARALFELEAEDLAVVTEAIGEGALRDRLLTLSKGYQGELLLSCVVDEEAALRNVLSRHQLTPEVTGQLEGAGSVGTALEVLRSVEQTESVKKLVALLQEVAQVKGFGPHLCKKALRPRVPKFLYFDEYYQMKGRANIEQLKQRTQERKLVPSDYPLWGLINRARLNLDELLNPSRTRDLKNRLEGAGNHLTKQVVKYWSQNRYLELRFDVRPGRAEDPEGMRSGTNIWSDVYDSKHKVTTELGTRSRGFVWFFSFLAWYGDVLRGKEPVILLLDEPGLSLHGKAQEDLLEYFESEIKGNHQLIYTTHSPFMVEPTHFERVRIVQDRSIDGEEELAREQEGTKVLTDVLQATGDSLFPLQGALGYEIYQTLFIGPNSLVVEGVSDLLYLQAMSAIMEERGRVGLSEQWTITPVGGSDKVPTFVALIGAQKHLNVAVLVDYQKKDRQPIENLYKRKLLEKKQVLTFADFTGLVEADIEDMFEEEFYLGLVNAEYGSALARPLTQASMNRRKPRVLERVDEFLAANPLRSGGGFNHYRPARYFAEHTSDLAERLSESTLARFERMFERLNTLVRRT